MKGRLNDGSLVGQGRCQETLFHAYTGLRQGYVSHAFIREGAPQAHGSTRSAQASRVVQASDNGKTNGGATRTERADQPQNDRRRGNRGPWGVIFDLDGTLVESEFLYYEATEEMLRPVGRSLEELTPEERSRIPGRSPVENMEFYRRKFGLGAPAEELARERMEVILEMLDRVEVPLVPGARRLLVSLSRHWARLALASSSPRNYVEKVLRKTGLEEFFPVVFTGDECERYKPDPEIFLKALATLGTRREKTVVVEDAHAGILAARAAGLKVVVVYGENTLEHQRALADLAVQNLSELSPEKLYQLLDPEGVSSVSP